MQSMRALAPRLLAPRRALAPQLLAPVRLLGAPAGAPKPAGSSAGAPKRTVVDESSCPRVSGPPAPADLARIERLVADLRARFPGAIIDRYLEKVPSVGEGAHICEGAALVGDVRIGEGASVWYGTVVRGDLNYIELGARSNLQDGTVVHLGDKDPTIVGEDVVVGHRAILHGCTIEPGCLIGMNATVLDGAVIGRGSIVGAGCVVPAGTAIPPDSLVLGMPGKVVKTLEPSKEGFNRSLAAKYSRLAYNYLHG